VVADHDAGTLSALVGGSGGSFGGPTTVAIGTGTAAVAVGDFNRDGDPDLATTHPTTNKVSVLLNTTVTKPTTTATTPSPTRPATAPCGRDRPR
jgi:hypothetical protein